MSIQLGPWAVTTTLVSLVPVSVRRTRQRHGGTIVAADEIAANTVADGIAADFSFRQPFMVTTADCLPLVVAGEAAACVLHISRKTLIRGLLDGVATVLDPATVRGVWVGPHICARHFVFEERGEEVMVFCERYPFACVEDAAGVHLSLVSVVEHQLKKWNISVDVVTHDGRCTVETPELPSYRRSWRDNVLPLTDQIATVVKSLLD